MAALDTYTVVSKTDPPKRKDNVIPKPEGFTFDSDEAAKNGQLVTVRLKAEPDDEDMLCITSIEGIPMKGYEDDEETETAAVEAVEDEPTE